MGKPIEIKRVGHTIHVIGDQKAARELYINVFGGIVWMEGYLEPEDRDANLLYVADHMIEPMSPCGNDNSKPVARFLEKYGAGWQGAHFMMNNLEELDAVEKMLNEFEIPTAQVMPGMGYFFVHPKYAHGINIEVSSMMMPGDPYDYPNWNPEWAKGNSASVERISSLNFALKEIEWARKFFTEGWAGKVVHEDSVDAPEPMDRCFIEIGGTVLAICAPKGSDAGPLSRYIEGRGAGVYSITWKVADMAQTRSHLTESRMAQAYGFNLSDEFCSTGTVAIDPAQFLGAVHEFTEKDPWA